MRIQQFLETLKEFNRPDDRRGLDELARVPFINGGWEVWLQVEIARYMKNKLGDNITFRREELYRLCPAPGYADPRRLRSDFYVEYPRTIADSTYFELKCINPFHTTPVVDAWNRFEADLAKIYNLYYKQDAIKGAMGYSFPATALLATHQSYSSLKAHFDHLIAVDSLFILDVNASIVYPRDATVPNADTPKFLIIAASPICTPTKR